MFNSIFNPLTIFLTIIIQLVIIGIFDKFKPVNRKKNKHMLMMWVIVLCTILFAFCIANMIANLTLADFMIVDEITKFHPRGIELHTIGMLSIPMIIMLLMSLFCEWDALLNIPILFFVSVLILFLNS